LPPHSKLELLYQASLDSFKANVFHAKCDNKGPTVVLAISKVHRKIFGGYTNLSWSSNEGWKMG
jgi:hypothetical protein